MSCYLFCPAIRDAPRAPLENRSDPFFAPFFARHPRAAAAQPRALRALVTAREQAKVGQINSSRAAIAALGTRIAELRSKVRHNDSLREPDRAAVLKHLDDLSDRLATLTAEK